MSQELTAFNSVDPNEHHVVLGHLECRDCGECSPWVRANEWGTLMTDWEVEHSRQTGHKKFYMWSVTRNTFRIG